MNWQNARSWTASWEWGDAPAWAAFVLAAIAVVISIRAQRDGRRSANAAEKSVTAAEKSVEEARLSRIASEKSTAIAEETLADQRREAAERRAAEVEAARPRPDLFIKYRGGSQFHLINRGTGLAENIRVVEEHHAMDPWGEVSLGANEVYPFMMAGDNSGLVPGAIKLAWDGLTEPVSVLVPPNSA